MNTLPFLLMMFAIFTLITTPFFTQYSYTEHLCHANKVRSDLERSLRFDETKKTFQKISGNKKKSSTEKERKPSEKEMVYFREKNLLAIDARLFIHTLFTDNPEEHLYSYTLHLFKECYGHYFHEKSLEDLLKEMIEKGKKAKTLSFAELFPDTPELKELYYLLLCGTQNQQGGFPPLSDIISLSQRNKIAFFNRARPEVLIALFGKIWADKIMQKEKEHAKSGKNKPLTKDEVTKLSPGEATPSIGFSHKGLIQSDKKMLTTDKQTDMALRFKISEGMR